MSRLMLQSDLVAAVSNESHRDLRALRDVNDKAPVDIARNMGADTNLVQVQTYQRDQGRLLSAQINAYIAT